MLRSWPRGIIPKDTKVIDLDPKYNSTIAEWKRMIVFQDFKTFKFQKEAVMWDCLLDLVAKVFKVDDKAKISSGNKFEYTFKDIKQTYEVLKACEKSFTITLYCSANKQYFWLCFKIEKVKFTKEVYKFFYIEIMKHYKSLETFNPVDNVFRASFNKIASNRLEIYNNMLMDILHKVR